MPEETRFLYKELAPKDRIKKLFDEFITEDLSKQGFKFLKSKFRYSKREGWFQKSISIGASQRNGGDHIVNFDLSINIFSDKYKKWELAYYGDNSQIGGPYISGGSVSYFEGWDTTYIDSLWYQLAKRDNILIMEHIHKNIHEVALPYFANFDTTELAIDFMKKAPSKYFNKVFDFLIIQKRIDEAVEFFHQNNSQLERMLEEDGENPASHFYRNLKRTYLLRRAKAAELAEV
ncbi:MAG: hypothetical protein MRZ79_27520 [Bacteroidia bacterium]|nr:hypothetical protein [Bacteroidia bacterium]